MLTNHSKRIKHTTQCLTDYPFMIIARPDDPGNANIRIAITYINEQEEKTLESGKSLSLKRGKLSFHVDPDLCFAYGELDFSPNSKDIIAMDSANWFNRICIKQYMVSDYDYNTHSVTSDIKGGRWYDTDSLKTFLPYLYGCIGKPKRVVIFKEYVDFVAIAKSRREAKRYKENKESIKKKAQEKSKNKKAVKLQSLVFNFNV